MAGQVVDRANRREQALVGLQVVRLLVGLDHRGEAERAGRHVEQVARQHELGGLVLRLRVVGHLGGHRGVLLRRDVAVEAVEVEAVDRDAGRDARELARGRGAELRTEEERGRARHRHARTGAVGIVLGARDGEVPVEAVGEAAAQAEREVVGLLVELLVGALDAAVLRRQQRADREDRGAELRVVVLAVGLRAAEPLLDAAAQAAFRVVALQAGPRLHAVVEVEGAVDVARGVVLLVDDRLLRQELVPAATRAEGGAGGGADVVERHPFRMRAAVVTGRLGVGRARAGTTDLRADRGLDAAEARRAVDARRERVVLDRVHEVALECEQRLAVEVFEGVGDAPVVAGAATDPLQVADVAAAAGRGLHAQLDVVAFVVGLQDHVHHARNRVGTVDRRRAAGQDLDPLDGAGRDVVEVLEVALAVVRERIVRRAAAVDQQQGTAWAEAAQVDHGGVRGEAAGRVQVVLGRTAGLGDRLQRVGDGDEAFAFELLARDHGDRSRSLDLGALDARTGDDDLLERLLFFRGGRCIVVIGLREGEGGNREEQRRRQRERERVAGITGLAGHRF
jgi:hypothetical protein